MSTLVTLPSHLSQWEVISIAVVGFLTSVLHFYVRTQDARREQEMTRDLHHLTLHCRNLRRRLQEYGESPDVVESEAVHRVLGTAEEEDLEEEYNDDDEEEVVQEGGVITPDSEPAEPQAKEEEADLEAQPEFESEPEEESEEEEEEDDEDNDWDGLSDSHSDVTTSPVPSESSSSSSELI